MPNVSLDQKIAALYVGFFSRAPDYNGLSYWKQQATSGGYNNDLSLLKAISAGFAQHPQFTLDYGSLDNIGFVNRLYENMLGGAGDAAGIAYWKDLLDTGTSRADLVAQFINGAMLVDIEAYAATNPSFSDADKAAAYVKQNTLLNKTSVAISFATQLGSLTNIEQEQYSDLTLSPAYQASQSILIGVTDDIASVSNKQSYIASIKNESDPIQEILTTNNTTTINLIGAFNGAVFNNLDSLLTYDAALDDYNFILDLSSARPVVQLSSSDGYNPSSYAARDLREKIINFDAGDTLTIKNYDSSTDLNFINNYNSFIISTQGPYDIFGELTDSYITNSITLLGLYVPDDTVEAFNATGKGQIIFE